MLGPGAAVNLDGAPEQPASSAPRLVLPLLQSHGLIAACAGLVVLLIGLQALSGDPQFRRDLRGAASLLLGYLLLRTVDLYRGAQLARRDPSSPRAGLDAGPDLRLHPHDGLGRPQDGSRAEAADPEILRDVLDGTLYLVATLIIVQREFRIDFSSLLAGSAIVSVVIGLALQETLGNLFAGLAIQLERPFQVGDTISMGNEISGRIVQIGWRATRVDNKRREVISLPNTTFSKQGVKNYLPRERAGRVRHVRRAHLRHPAQPGEGGHPRDPGGGAARPGRADGSNPHLGVRGLGHQVPDPLLRRRCDPDQLGA